jgi:hypothetical protein
MLIDSPFREETLRSLAADRPVRLCAREIGFQAQMPIAYGRPPTGLELCSPCFLPWRSEVSVHYIFGTLVVMAPLLVIMQMGGHDRIMSALRLRPHPILPGLPWPDSVLDFLARGDSEAGRRHLAGFERWMPIGGDQWERAAGYWWCFFRDRHKARECMVRAGGGNPGRAVSWQSFCGDSLSAMAYLPSDLNATPSADPLERLRCIRSADAWATVGGRCAPVNEYLGLAEKTVAANGTVSLFFNAMAWSALAADERRASLCAEEGMRQEREFAGPAALFWQCFRYRHDLAAACMDDDRWWGSSPVAVIRRANLMRVFDIQPATAETLLLSLDPDWLTPEQCCDAARAWLFLFERSDKTEEMMSHALSGASETCDYTKIAETYPDLGCFDLPQQRMASCEALRRAERAAGNAIDDWICAVAWKRVAGDEDAARRCLTRAVNRCDGGQDVMLVAEGWRDLLGRPEEAQRLLLGRGKCTPGIA